MTQPFDIVARANQEMIDAGFKPFFEAEVQAEVQAEIQAQSKLAQQTSADSNLRDLRSLLWSSIDNQESQDLDQIEYAEELSDGKIRLLIGIADVDTFAEKDTAIDEHAAHNTTSVYTGIVTYPMLPEELSYDRTSLLPQQDRIAMCIELTIGADGTVVHTDAYRALVNNKAKLDYATVGRWLDNTKNPVPSKIAQVAGLTEQILLQNKVKDHIHALREQRGALALHTQEARTVAKDGQILDLELVESNPARDLIENCMVAANIATSKFLEAKGIPSIMRTVRNPDRWPRIVEVAKTYGTDLPSEPDAKALAAFLTAQKNSNPEFSELSLTIVKLLGRGEYIVKVPGQHVAGHFALAVNEYTHSTAPNRRYPDLITQRILKSVLQQKPSPYSAEDLTAITQRCSQMESQAKVVERTMRKIAAAVLLSKRIGDIFDGVITGIKPDSVYVRTYRPPVEGKIVNLKGHNLDVGDHVKVKLLSTDPERAYIDFVFDSKK